MAGLYPLKAYLVLSLLGTILLMYEGRCAEVAREEGPPMKVAYSNHPNHAHPCAASLIKSLPINLAPADWAVRNQAFVRGHDLSTHYIHPQEIVDDLTYWLGQAEQDLNVIQENKFSKNVSLHSIRRNIAGLMIKLNIYGHQIPLPLEDRSADMAAHKELQAQLERLEKLIGMLNGIITEKLPSKYLKLVTGVLSYQKSLPALVLQFQTTSLHIYEEVPEYLEKNGNLLGEQFNRSLIGASGHTEQKIELYQFLYFKLYNSFISRLAELINASGSLQAQPYRVAFSAYGEILGLKFELLPNAKANPHDPYGVASLLKTVRNIKEFAHQIGEDDLVIVYSHKNQFARLGLDDKFGTIVYDRFANLEPRYYQPDIFDIPFSVLANLENEQILTSRLAYYLNLLQQHSAIKQGKAPYRGTLYAMLKRPPENQTGKQISRKFEYNFNRKFLISPQQNEDNPDKLWMFSLDILWARQAAEASYKKHPVLGPDPRVKQRYEQLRATNNRQLKLWSRAAKSFVAYMQETIKDSDRYKIRFLATGRDGELVNVVITFASRKNAWPSAFTYIVTLPAPPEFHLGGLPYGDEVAISYKSLLGPNPDGLTNNEFIKTKVRPIMVQKVQEHLQGLAKELEQSFGPLTDQENLAKLRTSQDIKEINDALFLSNADLGDFHL
ncbi:MAG: hypothetical protein J6Y94_05775 [Bacteriovoracaceae bacterium]|nr:hypothetical protein [Bacteriovoracaceae bacterium]